MKGLVGITLARSNDDGQGHSDGRVRNVLKCIRNSKRSLNFRGQEEQEKSGNRSVSSSRYAS